MDPTALRQKAQRLLEQAKAVQANADAEKRDLTAEEAGQVDEFLNQREAALASAERLERIASADAYAAGNDDDNLRRTSRRVITAPDDGDPTARAPATARDRAAEARNGWPHFGEFASAVARAMSPQTARSADRRLFVDADGVEFGAAASGMSQGVGPDGGFLVPPEFSTAIWDGLNDPTDSLLGRTDNYTITGESLTFPANAETSRATGSRYGGIRGYWIAEAAQMTASNPKFRQMKLEPQQLAVLCYVTDKLLRNSAVALEQYLQRAATDEINWLVGNAIVNGTGAGQPLGILNSGCLVSIAKESGQVADTVDGANIVKMWGRLHARSRANAIWLVNQDVEQQLYRMVFQRTTPATPLSDVAVFMPAGGLSGQQFSTLFGRPIVPVEYCPTVGDVGDIILADLTAYATGTRGGVDAATSMHLRFDYAETAFRFMFEVDGQPWLQSALTPANSTATLSTFVALDARAA